MNTITITPPPRQKNEIAINARLLFLYVGRPEISYDKWEASLHQMAASGGHISRFRIMTGDDGELALNLDFASYFAYLAATDLVGSIALILIEEGLYAAIRDDFNYTNQMLNAYKALAVARGQMCAETLHTFLQVVEPYDQWITRLKKKHCMRSGRDYVRVNCDTKRGPKMHRTDTQKGDVILGPRLAKKIATDESTRRSKMAQKFLR